MMTNQDIKTILCENCGALNSESDRWCRSCGNPFPDDPIRILPPGTSLDHGHFTITAFLGRGGSALTYRAIQKNFTAEVAVKEFYPAGIAKRGQEGYKVEPVSPDVELYYEQGRKQFMNAGNTLHSLGNIPNIVSVHDAFTDNGTAYVIEDYIDGISLYEMIHQKRRFTYDEAVNFIEPVMKALIKVHENGIIHRDINPSNIMVSKGTAYLIDFGIAKKIRNRTMSEFYKNEDGSGSDFYTGGYAAPEQITGSAQEAAWTDVYGIAATLYRMITGHEPDDARSRIISDLMPPPVETGADVTELQSKVIMQGMALNTVVRYQNVTAFLKALKSCMNEGRDPEPEHDTIPVEEKEGNREEHFTFLLKSAFILLLCILVGIAGFNWDSIKELSFFKGESSSDSREDKHSDASDEEKEENEPELVFGPDTVNYSGKAYEVFSASEEGLHTKEEMRKFCQDHGGKLAVGETTDQCRFLARLILNSGLQNAVIETQKYAIGIKHDPFSDEADYFICQWEESKPEAEEDKPCPDQARIYNGHSYQLIEYSAAEVYEWEELLDYCALRGGYPAVINDIAENNYLYRYTVDLGKENVVFGYTDVQEEGHWVWVHGNSDFTDYWANDSLPDNDHGVEHFCSFHDISANGMWNDVPFKLYTDSFLCEWDDVADKP